MLIAYITVIGGLSLLVFGATKFIIGAASTARGLRVSPLIIGMTIVGIATSAPEVLVGSVAAFDKKTGIAIGNAIGSNIANVGLVLGATILVKPFVIVSQTLRREYFFMCVSMVIALVLMLDGDLSRSDGFILIVCLTAIVFWIVKLVKVSAQADTLAGEFEKELKEVQPLGKSLLLLMFGLLVLLLGAHLLVDGAVTVARYFGVSDLIIGLTIIAIGTSLPELAASIISVLKNEADIAVGNIIGSNMFNMLMVLGIPSMIHPDTFTDNVLLRDFPIMVFLALMLGWMVFIQGKRKFDRIDGVALLICFIAYQYWLFSKV